MGRIKYPGKYLVNDRVWIDTGADRPYAFKVLHYSVDGYYELCDDSLAEPVIKHEDNIYGTEEAAQDAILERLKKEQLKYEQKASEYLSRVREATRRQEQLRSAVRDGAVISKYAAVAQSSYVSGLTVVRGGILHINADATVQDLTIMPAGIVYVSGGSVINAIASGGTMTISDGRIDGLKVYAAHIGAGGKYTKLYNVDVNAGGEIVLHHAAVVSHLQMVSSCSVLVCSEGRADDVTVTSGGTITLSTEAKLSGCYVAPCGYLRRHSDCEINKLIIASGGRITTIED